MDINHLINLLVDDVKQVIGWIDTHGEDFLNKHVGVGRNLQRTRDIQKSYKNFDEVAQKTYSNAGKLLGAAHELGQNDSCDSREMCRLAAELDTRVQQFSVKVEERKSVLNKVANFYRDEVYVSQQLEQFRQRLIMIESVKTLLCPASVELVGESMVNLDKSTKIFGQVRRVLDEGNSIIDILNKRASELTKGEPLSKLLANNLYLVKPPPSSSGAAPNGRPQSTSSQSSQSSSTNSSHYAQNSSIARQHAMPVNKPLENSASSPTTNPQHLMTSSHSVTLSSSAHISNHQHHHKSSSSSTSSQAYHAATNETSHTRTASSSSSSGPNHDQSATPASTSSSNSTSSPLYSLATSIQAVENIIGRLKDDLIKTDEYYKKHRKGLDLCLQLKLYEKDVLDASQQLDLAIEDMQNAAQRLPNIQTVSSGEKLLKLHNTTSKKLRELVFEIIKKGQELMANLKQSPYNILLDDQSALEQMNVLVEYMDQRAQEADELSECRRMHIEYSIKFRQFEVDAQQVQSWIKKGESMLIASFHIPLSLKEAEELRASHEKFQQAFERSHASTLQFKQRAQALIQADYFEEDSINQITLEVESMWQQLMTHAEDRFKLIKGAINFYKTSDKVREVLESLENDYQMNEDYCGIERYGGKTVAECLKEAAINEAKSRPQNANGKWTGNSLTVTIQQQQTKHREQKEAFLKGCTLVRRKAEAFLKYSVRCADRTYTSAESISTKSLIKNVEQRVKNELETIFKQENKVLEFWSSRKTQIDHCQQFALVENCACHLLEWISQNTEAISSKKGSVRYEQFLEFEHSFKGTEDAVRKIYQESYVVIERGHSHASVLREVVEYLNARFKEFVKRYDDYKTGFYLDRQTQDRPKNDNDLVSKSSRNSLESNNLDSTDSVNKPYTPLVRSNLNYKSNLQQNKDRNSDSGVEGDSISSKETHTDTCSSSLASNNWLSHYASHKISTNQIISNNLNNNNNNILLDINTTKPQPLSISIERKRKSLTRKEYIMAELLTTEKTYVTDLETCIRIYLKGYREAGPELPVDLKDKESTIFGNLEDICKFHKNIFLKELEKYETMPEDVGHCFVTWSKSFDVYIEYCKNATESNKLIVLGLSFFEELQHRNHLSHEVSAYLIKPVQRIVKYRQLLENLLLSCDEVGQSEIKDGLDVMISVPKKANDAMHLSMLVGCDIPISSLGEVILQDSFQVTDTKSLLRKTRERRVFLFEFYLVFSKEVKVETNQQKSHYQFKSKIMLSDIINLIDCGSGSSNNGSGAGTNSGSATSNTSNQQSANNKDAIESDKSGNDGTKIILIHSNKSLKSRDSTCKIILKAIDAETKNQWVKAHRELMAESNFRPFGQEASNLKKD